MEYLRKPEDSKEEHLARLLESLKQRDDDLKNRDEEIKNLKTNPPAHSGNGENEPEGEPTVATPALVPEFEYDGEESGDGEEADDKEEEDDNKVTTIVSHIEVAMMYQWHWKGEDSCQPCNVALESACACIQADCSASDALKALHAIREIRDAMPKRSTSCDFATLHFKEAMHGLRDIIVLHCMALCTNPKDREEFLQIVGQVYDKVLDLEQRAQLLLAYHKQNLVDGFVSNNYLEYLQRGYRRPPRRKDRKKLYEYEASQSKGLAEQKKKEYEKEYEYKDRTNPKDQSMVPEGSRSPEYVYNMWQHQSMVPEGSSAEYEYMWQQQQWLWLQQQRLWQQQQWLWQQQQCGYFHPPAQEVYCALWIWCGGFAIYAEPDAA